MRTSSFRPPTFGPLTFALVPGLAIFALCSSVSAGPHAGGVLILDDGPDLVGCEDLSHLCPYVEEHDPLVDCASANPHFDSEYGYGLWTIYAAFPEGSSPRLAGLTFGVDYDDSAILVGAYESCGDFELSTSDWPLPGSGDAVTWVEAQTTQVVRVYVFGGYEYYGLDTSFDLVPHPILGADFADDDIPSNLDPIADFGRLGFNGNPGYLPCFVGGVGACCFCPSGDCAILFSGDCDDAGGTFQGDGTTCDPNPCDCPPVGACCPPEGPCRLATSGECAGLGGEYIGDGTTCDPDPCEVVPTIGSSWGAIKRMYR